MNNKERDLLSQFSAYAKVAIKHTRQEYLEKRARIRSCEVPYYEEEMAEEVDERDILCQVEQMSVNLEKEVMDIRLLLAQIDNSLLVQTVMGLTRLQKEVLLLRIVYMKTYREIGSMLGMTPKKAENTYYNTIRKIRRLMGGNTDGI